MENVSLIFRSLVIDQRSPLEPWKQSYISLIKDIQVIRQKLQANPTLSMKDAQLYARLDITDYNNLLYRLIYEASNGVSGKGRATLPKVVFTKLYNDTAFEAVLKDAFINPDKNASYNAFRSWWTNFCKTNGSMDFKMLVNRAVAAIQPEIATVTVDEGKFNEVITELNQTCNFPLINGSWLAKNIELTKWLDDKIAPELDELDKLYNDPAIRLFYRNVFTWALFENGTTDLFDLHKQIIKYGPPGTGKTYTCQRNAFYHFENWTSKYSPSFKGNFENHVERIQFHPSFTYEDFIEGLRPVPDVSGKTALKLVPGIFKSFCTRASQWERDVYAALPDQIDSWEDLTVKDIKEKVQGAHWRFLADAEDEDALDNIIPPFYFIIDEINRAELSRVFGELMFSLEYRGYAGKIKTQYSQLASAGDENEYWMENGQNFFFIPHNVYLFGTMNTIDRSVESFDFALRRRFRWKEVLPNYSVAKLFFKENGCEKFEKVVDNLQALNNKISSDTRLLGKDYQIGHSYLMKLNDKIKMMSVQGYNQYVWQNNLFPLIEEYLRGTAEPGEIKNKLEELKKAFVPA